VHHRWENLQAIQSILFLVTATGENKAVTAFPKTEPNAFLAVKKHNPASRYLPLFFFPAQWTRASQQTP